MLAPTSARRLRPSIWLSDWQASTAATGSCADLFQAMGELIKEERRADLVTLSPTYRGKKIFDTDAEDYVRNLVEYASTGERLADYVREVLHYAAQRGVMTAARKPPAGPDVAPLRLLTETARRHVLDHALAQRRNSGRVRHGVFLSLSEVAKHLDPQGRGLPIPLPTPSPPVTGPAEPPPRAAAIAAAI